MHYLPRTYRGGRLPHGQLHGTYHPDLQKLPEIKPNFPEIKLNFREIKLNFPEERDTRSRIKLNPPSLLGRLHEGPCVCIGVEPWRFQPGWLRAVCAGCGMIVWRRAVCRDIDIAGLMHGSRYVRAAAGRGRGGGGRRGQKSATPRTPCSL